MVSRRPGMKRALGDMFLMATISVLLIASIIFGYFIFEDSAISLSFGQPLTERQKEKAIAIVLGDPLVSQEAEHMANWANGTYHVKDVLSPSPFHEVGPGIDRNRSLPAVEIVVGNEADMGTNILAFVDLAKNRVAYIGYVKRADAYGQLPPESHTNISIAETDYTVGKVLTGEQREKVVRIARENKAVQEKMRGKNYSVDGDVMVSYISFYKDDNLYVGAYPMVRFTEGTSMYEPDFLIDVVLDADRGEVLNSWVLVRTPVLRS
jgi:hypothetical protein